MKSVETIWIEVALLEFLPCGKTDRQVFIDN
jgi:hypothetical protein